MSGQQSPNGEIFLCVWFTVRKSKQRGKNGKIQKKKKKRSERPDQKSRSREVLRVINLSGVWVLGNLLFFFGFSNFRVARRLAFSISFAVIN